MRDRSNTLLERISDLERRLRNAQQAKRAAREQNLRLRAQIRELRPDAEAHRRWQHHIARLTAREPHGMD